MATETDFCNRVLHLLASTAVSKVEFTLDGVKITKASFSKVTLAIKEKAAGNKGLGFRTGKVPADADAGYDPEDDVFDVPGWDYGTQVYQRQALVHEAIHAYLDLISSNTTALTDEAIAYVGGMLFHIHDTTAAGATPTAPAWATVAGVSVTEAFRIASGLFTSGSTVVSDADAKSMRDTIANRPAYAALKADPTIKYGNNGLK
jgi:hypothetical protein